MKNADVPMLYNNICKSPPTIEKPATASLIPNDTAAPLEEVEVELEEVPVPDAPARLVGVAVVPQKYLPWMTLLTPASASKELQSISC